MLTINIVPGRIGLHPYDFIIFDVELQGTTAAAVYGTSAPNHFFFNGLYRLLYAAAAVRIPKGNDSPPAASASELIAEDFTNVLRLMPPYCSVFDITHPIIVIAIY